MSKQLAAENVYFDVDLRDVILSGLPLRRDTAAHRAKLESKNTSELLIIYYNWQGRRVHPHKRTVYRSDTFRHAIANSPQSSAIGQMLAKIAIRCVAEVGWRTC